MWSIWEHTCIELSEILDLSTSRGQLLWSFSPCLPTDVAWTTSASTDPPRISGPSSVYKHNIYFMKIGTAINNILFFHSQFFTCTGIYIHKIIWEIQKISELLFLKISLSLYTYIYTLWTHNTCISMKKFCLKVKAIMCLHFQALGLKYLIANT